MNQKRPLYLLFVCLIATTALVAMDNPGSNANSPSVPTFKKKTYADKAKSALDSDAGNQTPSDIECTTSATQEQAKQQAMQTSIKDDVRYVFRNAKKMQQLCVSNNPLKHVPHAALCHPKMKVFQAANTSINGTLPDTLAISEQLQYLDITGAGVQQLPNSIGNSTNLVTLKAGRNYLSTLPDTLGLCTQLRVLELQNNVLTSLPDSLENLTELEFVDLRNNKIPSLYTANQASDNS